MADYFFQQQTAHQFSIFQENILKRPSGFIPLRLTQEPSSPPVMVPWHLKDVIYQAAPPAKKQKPVAVPLNTVHERRKNSKDFRRKQFERRRQAEKEWIEYHAQAKQLQNAKIREAAQLRKSQKQSLAQKKGKPLNTVNCPLDTCPKRRRKDRCGSPSSVLTHISQDSGRRSRSPIIFGSENIR